LPAGLWSSYSKPCIRAGADADIIDRRGPRADVSDEAPVSDLVLPDQSPASDQVSGSDQSTVSDEATTPSAFETARASELATSIYEELSGAVAEADAL